MQENKNIELPLFDDFLLYLKTQNYSEETIYSYERDLRVFEDFLIDYPSPINFDRVSKTIVNEYKAYLSYRDRLTSINKNKGKVKLSSYSLNKMLSSFRSY